jgi:hypothetical protein
LQTPYSLISLSWWQGLQLHQIFGRALSVLLQYNNQDSHPTKPSKSCSCMFSPHFVLFHSFYLHVPEHINKLWSLQIQLLNKKCMTLSISMDSNNWSIIHLTLIALIAAIVGSPQSVTHNSVSYKHYKFVTLFAGHWVVCCRPNHGFTICPKQKQQLQSQHFLVSCRRKSQNNIFQNTLPSFKT